MKKQTSGALLLLLGTMIWGVAFVAQTSAADVIGAFTFNAARSLIAAILLTAILLIKEKTKTNRIEKTTDAGDTTARKKAMKKSLFAGAVCGVALFAAVNFQQFGIENYPNGVSASGRAGFLTATYVVIVAAYTAIRRRKMHPLTAVSCVGCVAGMYLLCVHGGVSKIYLGDVLELLGALSFAVQILIIDRFSDCDGIAMSCAQFWTVTVLSAVCAAIFETVRVSDLAAAWLPIAYAGVMSSCLGYTFQILGQKHVKPTVASMIMSLESVFAALAGWIILKERLSPVELAGCALVFVSVILSQLTQNEGEKQKSENKCEKRDD
ncbi:MAG: DMT family transporter [Candidatus Borkfalkiaceae bacterium]|nr:DMT family transporter [Clostridia bacterium]MDY6223291.1 DMT family transporter [Christensenellaceae bacterium]